MSLIGKKVTVEYPVSNDKTEKMTGIVVDKFKNSFVDQRQIGDGKNTHVVPLVVTYDNYLIKGEDGKTTSVHPTLIIKIED